MTVQAPFKYDVVGSFLRPDYLKKLEKNLRMERLMRNN